MKRRGTTSEAIFLARRRCREVLEQLIISLLDIVLSINVLLQLK